jgi:hypothetical protein
LDELALTASDRFPTTSATLFDIDDAMWLGVENYYRKTKCSIGEATIAAVASRAIYSYEDFDTAVTVNGATATFTTIASAAHGLLQADEVTFDTADTNIAIGGHYFVKYLSPSTFQISVTPGGTALALSTHTNHVTKWAASRIFDVRHIEYNDIPLDQVTEAQLARMNPRWRSAPDGTPRYWLPWGERKFRVHPAAASGPLTVIATNAVSGTPSTANKFTLVGHDLIEGEQITFDTADTDIVVGTTYFVKWISADMFQIAATLGGTAIVLTDHVNHAMSLTAEDILFEGYELPSATIFDSDSDVLPIDSTDHKLIAMYAALMGFYNFPLDENMMRLNTIYPQLQQGLLLAYNRIHGTGDRIPIFGGNAGRSEATSPMIGATFTNIP